MVAQQDDDPHLQRLRQWRRTSGRSSERARGCRMRRMMGSEERRRTCGGAAPAHPRRWWQGRSLQTNTSGASPTSAALEAVSVRKHVRKGLTSAQTASLKFWYVSDSISSLFCKQSHYKQIYRVRWEDRRGKFLVVNTQFQSVLFIYVRMCLNV